jgi:ABC-type molybdate transport system substrate-binding protein
VSGVSTAARFRLALAVLACGFGLLANGAGASAASGGITVFAAASLTQVFPAIVADNTYSTLATRPTG